MSEDQGRTRLIIGGLVVLVALVVGILVWSPFPRHEGPATNEILDADGNLAMAMPSLADDITVTHNDDGSADVAFSIQYDVAHPGRATPPMPGTSAPTSSTAKPDMAVITLMVQPNQGAGGPIRLDPVFERQIEDRSLTDETTTSDYEVRLYPKTVTFLEGLGMGSGDDAKEEAALHAIDLDVQQLRDFQVVDGRYDWQQGRAYTGADAPVQASAVTDDSTVTVTNATGEGIAGPGQAEIWDSGTVYGGGTWETFDDTGAYATNIALSGAAVECIDQGDGSNPQGFSMLNGWDLEDDLPPGFLPPGGAITQQVNADESMGTASLDVADNTTAATLQVLAAVADQATGGVKDAATYGYMVALGLEDISTTATVALGVPILAIMGLAEAIHDIETDSCASFANIFNLTAVEPSGAQTSVSWGDQTDGLRLTYDSASHDGTAVTGNVQTIPSNQLAVSAVPDYEDPVAFQPYLEQDAQVSCGTGSSGPSDPYCEGSEQGNNVIDIGWSNLPMCPYKPAATACAPTAAQNAAVTEVTIPGTDLCGTDNELCPPVAAPNQDAAELDPEDAEAGAAYQVVDEFNPGSPVTGVAEVEDGTIWVGTQAGEIQQFDGEAMVTFEADDTNGGISALGASGSTLVWGDESGNLFTADTQADSWSPSRLDKAPAAIVDLVPDGNGGLYYAAGAGLAFYGSDGSIDAVTGPEASGATITDLATSTDDLYVGYEGGEIWRCALTDCASSWSEVHDDGFDSDVQAMAAVGDTLYVGLANGAQAQIDADTDETQVYVGPQTEGGTVAGMTAVDGNVFVGGCIGIQSPISGDLLGVEVLTQLTPSPDLQVTFAPEPSYQDCQNPTETTTKYKGFDADAYALVASPATSTHPPLVYVALTVNQENFFYVLESTTPFTTDLCTSGTCPEPPPTPTPPPPPPPPVGSLEAMGEPLVASSCGTAASVDATWVPASVEASTAYVAASTSAPLATAAGESVTSGFQLTPVTSSSQTCTTAWAWNLNHLGSLPYVAWQGNAYPAAATPGGQTWDAGTSLHQPIPVEIGGDAVPEGSTDPSNSSQQLATLTPVAVAAGGAQIQADVTDDDSLVLQVTIPAGDPAASIVVNADVLTETGQAIPPAVDLFEPPAPPTPASTTTTAASGSTSTSTSTSTTTTVPATTTTTLPPGCRVPGIPVTSTASALWPLDDRTTTALDVSGNGNDATITAAAAYDQAPGPMAACTGNGGLGFDGTSTVVTAPAAVDAALDEEHFSVMAHVNVPSGLTDGTATVLADDDPTVSTDGTALTLTIREGAVAEVVWNLGLSTGVMTVSSNAPLSSGTWHQLIGVFDTGARTGTLWVDGTAVAIGTAPGSMNPYLQTGSEPITLGMNPVSGEDGFEGLMADVAIVPQALTSAQVAAAWAATQGS